MIVQRVIERQADRRASAAATCLLRWRTSARLSKPEMKANHVAGSDRRDLRLCSFRRAAAGEAQLAADHATSNLGQAQVALDRQDEELAAANELLHGIIEASPAVILALDRDGKVILWNPAAESVFGYSRAEAIGNSHPVVPPDQRASFDAVMLQGDGR